jgi:hypothetical protein
MKAPYLMTAGAAKYLRHVSFSAIGTLKMREQIGLAARRSGSRAK